MVGVVGGVGVVGAGGRWWWGGVVVVGTGGRWEVAWGSWALVEVVVVR